jgi:hypothetical protein
MNRSAGLQPAYDSHHVCGIQLKEKINLAANVQSRSQTGAPKQALSGDITILGSIWLKWA